MTVTMSREGALAVVTLNRPDKLNAINREMRGALRSVFDEISVDDRIKVAIVGGAGAKAFSAGWDLSEETAMKPFDRRREVSWAPGNVIRACTKPVIAMIRGYALGGGAEVAAACDIRLGSESAVVGFPEIEHGWVPAGGGGTQLLPRIVGMGAAMTLVLTGRRIDATEAFRIGFLDAVVSDGELEDRARALAEEISAHRLRALVLAKAALRISERVSLDVGLEYEKEIAAIADHFEDKASAVSAFDAGRRVQFDY